MARQSFKITPGIIRKCEKLASKGLTLEQIAHRLGVSYMTLLKKRRACAELEDAIQRGKAEGIDEVSNVLYEKALTGDNTAMIFYLKNRDPENWEDVQKREYKAKLSGRVDTKIDINFVD